MACKIYLSTDDNAPVVAGNDRTCIINLLQKCLIDGYGPRNPVGGWTMPYRNTAGDIAVFRNSPEGTGHYLQIDHSSAVSSSQCFYKATAAEMVSSETDLQNTFATSPTLRSSGTDNATTRPWIVIASQKWVFLMVYTNRTGSIPTKAQLIASDGQTHGFWFGDYEKVFIDDAYNSMFSPLSYTHFGSSSSSTSSTGYYFSRNKQGTPGGKTGGAYISFPCIGHNFGASNSPAYTDQSGLYVCKIALNGGDNYTLRGWLPDALCPLHLRPFEQLEQIEINGTNYTAVCFSQGAQYSSTYVCQLLFEVEQ